MIVSDSEIASIQVKEVEEVKVDGRVLVKEMIVGSRVVLLKFMVKKGAKVPLHTHKHESVGYIVKGKIKMVIEGEEMVAEEGSAFLHPKGVVHSTEALEDTVYVEVKSPPSKAWSF